MNILTKILTGFGVVALILAGSIIFTASQVSENVTISDRVVNTRVPTAQAGLKILNGVNHSLAALRGWIILGKDKFVNERATAWANIDEAVGEMNRLSTTWTVKENKTKLQEINALLGEFKGYQGEIESIANTIDQRPDLKMLFEDAAPVAGIMSAEITKMIDQELTEDASFARKQLLGMMADVRGSLGLGLANIRAYLLSGDIKFKNRFDKFWTKNDKRFADLQASSGLLKKDQKIAFDKFSEARKIFAPIPSEMFEIRASNQYDMANYWLGTKAAPTAFKIKEILASLAVSQQKLLATDVEKAETMLSSLLSLQWVLLGIGLLLCAVVGVYLGRAISRPIAKVVDLTEVMNAEFEKLTEVIEAVANNDLTKRVEQNEIESIGINSKDEIGTLVRAIEGTLEAKNKMGASVSLMISNLSSMIGKLDGNANELVSASTEISSSAEQMARGAKEQTDQVTQISTAIEQMSATIVESSKNAGDATDKAKDAADTANSGGQLVQETVQGMQRINDVVRESGESIGRLAESADQIGEIVGVIDDIADQTNLLALNAAIEAARAGEQGRGFAVVADEVRKLAERTGKATGEITVMIKGIQSQTQEAVKSMETGVVEVDKGRELTDQAGNSLTEIVNMSQGVMDMIRQIATATEEQSSAAEQISRNIDGVASIARETSTGAEQSAAAAEQLNRQAEGLKTIVGQFKISSVDQG